MRALALALAPALLLGGCQVARVSRTALPASPCAPAIASVQDLGALPPASGETPDEGASDGRFVGGEWVAVRGTCLDGPDTAASLDGRPLAAQGPLAGGHLLLRLPGALRFRHTHTLTVRNAAGAAEHPVPATHFLTLGDARANRLSLWRTASDRSVVFEEEPYAVKLPRAGPFCFAPRGGLLFAAGAKGKKAGGGLFEFPLVTVHLAARSGPRAVSSVPFRAREAPVSVAASPEGPHLYVLTPGELLAFDASDPTAPRFLGATPLPGTASHRDLVLLAKGARAATLEQAGNRVHLWDLSDPAAPRPLASCAVVRGSDLARCVEMAADRSNPARLWVLTGVNTFQLKQRLLRPWTEAARSEFPAAGLVALELRGDVLEEGERRGLPAGTLPVSLFPEAGGDVLVTALSLEAGALGDAELSVDGLFDVLRGLRNAVFLGKILRAGPRGEATTEVRSVDLFLSLHSIEGGPLIYTTYRMAPSYFPPSLDVELGVDVFRLQRLTVREMGWETALPPYSFYPPLAVN